MEVTPFISKIPSEDFSLTNLKTAQTKPNIVNTDKTLRRKKTLRRRVRKKLQQTLF